MLERHAVGLLPDKHHIALRNAEGRLHYEECITRRGFDGPYTILYHQQRPHTQRSAPVEHGWALPRAAPVRPLAKRHYRTPDLVGKGGPPIDVRQPLLFNDDLVVSVLAPTQADPTYFVNGDADDLYFIFAGTGVLQSAFGDLRYQALDYICVPRGVLHRFVPDAEVSQHWLSLECKGGVGLLPQWRNEVGQLRMDAPYCHRDFRLPSFTGPRDDSMRELTVKRDDAFSGFLCKSSPLDVVGWDGSVYPWAFPILSFQPRVGLVHLPPTWHGTFAAGGALVCSFVPRPLDFHPQAIPCPYPHSSVDCDEMLFYCSGDFISRKGVGPGSISHHPAGLPHGPHPGAYEASMGQQRTEELAVMVDTFAPLLATELAVSVEDAGYQDSFI